MSASDDQTFLLLGFVGDNPVLHLSCAVAVSKPAAIAASPPPSQRNRRCSQTICPPPRPR